MTLVDKTHTYFPYEFSILAQLARLDGTFTVAFTVVALFVVLRFVIDLPSLFTAMGSKSNRSVTPPLFCG